jgi:Tfp pilus assembly protein PilW
MIDRLRNERGLTLIELTVVVVIATLVMVGMVGFYLTSQATWVEASGQAITQREGTSILERMTAHVRAGHHAMVSFGPSTILSIYDESSVEIARYSLEADSLLHEHTPDTPGGPLVDRGGLGNSTVEQFSAIASDSVVTIPALHLRSSNGEVVEFSTAIALYNR